MLLPEFKSLKELEKVFQTEQDCIDYFEWYRWKGNPVSPFDPTSKVYKCKSRKNWYICSRTKKYFNVRTGTIFENSKISLKDWFWAWCIFFSHKKGISSCQIARDLGITQKSGWFVLQRLRRASRIAEFENMLEGFVEIDETYLGGSNPNRHWDKKVPNSKGRSWKDKIPTIVMVKRKGNAIAKVVRDVKKSTLEPIIKANVKEDSNVFTDEWLAYNELYKTYKHQKVIHRIKQFVNGKASTNSAENFNSCIKRGYNTYHWISRKHAQRYIDEFVFRYNTRKHSEQERFNLILMSSIGKRLTYQELIS